MRVRGSVGLFDQGFGHGQAKADNVLLQLGDFELGGDPEVAPNALGHQPPDVVITQFELDGCSWRFRKTTGAATSDYCRLLAVTTVPF